MHLQTFAFCFVAFASCVLSHANGLSWIEDIEKQVSQLVGDLDLTLGELISEVKKVDNRLKEVSACYEPELGGKHFHIFNESFSFKTLVGDYYKAFPSKNITKKSIENLLESTKSIIGRCTDPDRSISPAKFGFTSLSDRSFNEISKMLGHLSDIYDIRSEKRPSGRLSGNDPACIARTNVPNFFDWRRQNVVTPVRDQGQCGDCWAFAAAASIESALLINQQAGQSAQSLALSPQMLLDCAESNGCGGGNSEYAFAFVRQNGIALAADMPYQGRVQYCPWNFNRLYRIRNYCVRSRYQYTANSMPENLSDMDIAQTLVQFGPLYIAIDSNPLIYQNYRSGVLADSMCTNQPNHAVLLVGYTPDAWIIKNSWGANWGEQGYFRVARNMNMCAINTEIAWPLL